MRWLPLLLLAGASPVVAQDPEARPRFREEVAVDRVLLDVRVLGPRGRVLQGLGAEAFEVRIDGMTARVESATWTAGRDAGGLDAETRARLDAAGFRTPSPGRLIVFLFQKDLTASRMRGLLQVKQRAGEMLARLDPADRVALLSYDSRLRLWVDFTTDRGRLRSALDESVLFGRAAPPETAADGEAVSLREGYDPTAARRAASLESGLRVLARALDPLPGPKSVVLFGHGFGTLAGSALHFDQDYGPARRELQEARASVFTIDVTQADYHTLEAGLQQVAWDTGGFYARAFHFAGQAVALVEAALEGHYALSVERPPGLARGRHRLSVALKGRSGSVVVAPAFRDRD